MTIRALIATPTLRLLVLLAVGLAIVVGLRLPQPPAAAAPPQQATATPTPTPSSFTDLYRNTTEGFTMTLPTGWVAQETGATMPLITVANPLGTKSLAGWVYVDRLSDLERADEWLRDKVTGYGFGEILADAPVVLGPGTSGHQIRFWWMHSSGEMTEEWTAVARGSQMFLIRTSAFSTGFLAQSDEIDAFTASFTLEIAKPFGASVDDSLFLLGGTILTLDPALYQGSPAGIPGTLFSGLVRLDRDLQVVPDLAESWELSTDRTVYTFNLRSDVRFHDGRPFTAEDVKYSWERAADPALESSTALTYLGDIVGVKARLGGEADDVAGIEVVDDTTLRVTIDAPKSYFLQKLVYPTAYIVDRTNVESGEGWTDAPNGTGAFKLKVWNKDDLLVVERNDHFYEGAPQLAHIVYRLFAGRSMTMYEQGEIDMTDVGVSSLARAQDPAGSLNEDLSVGTSFCTSYVGFNVTMAPFDDPRVREAFAKAIDINRIIDVSLEGALDRAAGILPPGMPAHNGALAPSAFDPEEARALLARSRYGGAENLPTIVSFAHDPAIHWMWEAYLGVEIAAVSLPEPQDALDRSNASEFPVFASGWCADYPDPQNFLEILFQSESNENHFAYANPFVDALLAEAGVEPDPSVREEQYQEIERLILGDWVVVPLWHSRSYELVRPYVKGYEITPIGIPIFREVSIAR